MYNSTGYIHICIERAGYLLQTPFILAVYHVCVDIKNKYMQVKKYNYHILELIITVLEVTS